MWKNNRPGIVKISLKKMEGEACSTIYPNLGNKYALIKRQPDFSTDTLN